MSHDFAPLDIITVRLGEHDHTIAGETITTDYEVESILRHQSHDVSTRDSDIALLRLKTKIAFSPTVYPISLPKSAGAPFNTLKNITKGHFEEETCA